MAKAIAARLASPYVRLSPKDERKHTDLGPEAQRSSMERFAKERGIALLPFCEDIDVSGRLPMERRPGLVRAVEQLLTSRAGILLVQKRDRLARGSPIVVATIEETVEHMGAVVWAAEGASNDNTPEGKVMRRMTDAFAEYERELIRARTRAALAVKKSRGECVGEVPYGYRAELTRVEETIDGVSQVRIKRGRLTQDPGEQAVIARIQQLRADRKSLQWIAEHLNDDEATLPRRGKWYATTVRRVLTRSDPVA